MFAALDALEAQAPRKKVLTASCLPCRRTDRLCQVRRRQDEHVDLRIVDEHGDTVALQQADRLVDNGVDRILR